MLRCALDNNLKATRSGFEARGPIIHSSGHSRARDRTRFESIARPLDGVFQIAEKVPVQASYYTLFAGTMTWRIAPSGNLSIPEL
jgi:hypothetical protein